MQRVKPLDPVPSCHRERTPERSSLVCHNLSRRFTFTRIFSTKNREPLLGEPQSHRTFMHIWVAFSVISTAPHWSSTPNPITLMCYSCSRVRMRRVMYSRATQTRLLGVAEDEGRCLRGGVPLAEWIRGVFGEPGPASKEVREYIQRQHEHHRRVSFQDELRAFLRRYEITFDERYVWD